MSPNFQTTNFGFLSAEQQAAHDAQAGGYQHFITHCDPRMPNFFAEHDDEDGLPASSSGAANGSSIPNFFAEHDEEDPNTSSAGAANGFSMQQPGAPAFGDFGLEFGSLFNDGNEMNQQHDAEDPQFPQYIDPRSLAGADSPIPSFEFPEDCGSLFGGSPEPEMSAKQQDMHGHVDVTMHDEQQVAPPAPATNAIEEPVQTTLLHSHTPKVPFKLASPPKKSAQAAPPVTQAAQKTSNLALPQKQSTQPALPATQVVQKPVNLARPQKQSAQAAPPVTQAVQKSSNLALRQKQSAQHAPQVAQAPAVPVQQNAAVAQAMAAAKKSRKRKQATEGDANPEPTVPMGTHILAAQLAAHAMQTHPPVLPPRPTSTSPPEQNDAYYTAMVTEYDRRKSHFVRVAVLSAEAATDGVAVAEPAPKKRKKAAKKDDTIEAPARRVPLQGYDPRLATSGQLNMILFLMSFAHRTPGTTPATPVQIQTIIDMVMSTDWLFLNPNDGSAANAKKAKKNKKAASASDAGNPVVPQVANSHQAVGNAQVYGNAAPSTHIAGNSPKDAIDLTDDNNDTPAVTGTINQMGSSGMHGNNQQQTNSARFVQTKTFANAPYHGATGGPHYGAAQGNHQQPGNFPGNMQVDSSTAGAHHGAAHGPVHMQLTQFAAPAMANMDANFNPTANAAVPDNFDPTNHFSVQAGPHDVANTPAAQPFNTCDFYEFAPTDMAEDTELTEADLAKVDHMLADTAAFLASTNHNQVNGYPTPDASNAGSSPAFVQQPFHTATQPSGNAEANTAIVHDHDVNMANTTTGADAGTVAPFTDEEVLGPHVACAGSPLCLFTGGYCFPEFAQQFNMTSIGAYSGTH